MCPALTSQPILNRTCKSNYILIYYFEVSKSTLGILPQYHNLTSLYRAALRNNPITAK